MDIKSRIIEYMDIDTRMKLGIPPRKLNTDFQLPRWEIEPAINSIMIWDHKMTAVITPDRTYITFSNTFGYSQFQYISL